MYEKFTDRARKVMQSANQEAERRNHEYIGTEHVLLGIIQQEDGVAANVLKNLGVDLHGILREVKELAAPGPGDVEVADLPMTPRTKQVIEYAIEESRLLRHNYVGTEHLLLGILREPECVANQVLANLGLTLDDVREEVVALLGPSPAPDDGSGADRPLPLPRLAPRAADAHKGHFGLTLIVGGSRGMAGAAALAGMAALRGGAGLVRMAVPDACLDTVAAVEPSYMTAALPSDRAGRIAWSAREKIEELAAAATVVACGPGVGRSLGLDALIHWMYARLPQPMVVDADGLNALAARRHALAEPGGPRVLTPHPGELARLLGVERVAADKRNAAAIGLAARLGVVIVLKGHQTRVTDGRQQAINTTGNPGMATGGSGDVLTGLIAALACQSLSPFDAAQLGAYLHGLAGDLAADELGQESLVASDLVRFLPEAFNQQRRKHSP
ncbi:MAG: NAD(P)H-hydrate dehydratase [Planctomycetota bacterium]|jgi:NAD(P)H-hydrate epimerase